MKTTSFIPLIFVLRFYIAETGVIIDVTLPSLFGALAKGGANGCRINTN